MNEPSVDLELVKRVQRGDKKAFDMLVVKYQHKIANLIARYIKDQAEVLDVTQEAFVKAYRALDNFRGESAFYTWLYRVAINTAKNHIVSKSRRPPAADIDSSEAETFDAADGLRDNGSPERLLLRDELKKVVFKVIEGLSEELRDSITLREIDGLSYEEIAKIMDCPVGTVRSRIFRARDAIDAAVLPLMENDSD
jgi:RNA polymerase sigma-70 factor (ECF subfamily)